MTELVSVVVPCRNERAYIEGCLRSILANEPPPGGLEVLVVDGMSDDGTREIVAGIAAEDGRVRLVDNPRRITPAALNLGVRHARGAIVARMDAHCRYPDDYLRRLLGWMERTGADNVGGVCRTLPADDGARARAIAIALAHPLAVGNAHFRIGVREATWADTVPFGCYRREVFARIGTWDEELVRNQDDEFNHRLLRHGGRILLVPDVVVDYFARASFGKLARMYYQYGYYKPLAVRKLGGVPTLRQLVPPAFVLTLAAGLLLAPWSGAARLALVAVVALYLAAIGTAAVRAAGRHGAAAAGGLLVAIPAIHLSYGVGYLRGVLDFGLRRRRPADVAGIPVSR